MKETKHNARFWTWSQAHNAHEELAKQGVLSLCGHPQHQWQWAVENRMRVIDMRLHGKNMRYAVPPALYEHVYDRVGFLEFESDRYDRQRYHQMIGALLNGAEQLKREWRKRTDTPLIHDVWTAPFMLVYARQLTRDLRAHFHPFHDTPGLYHQMVSNLSFFVLDCSAVPSDSEYTHLRMLLAPRAESKEEFYKKFDQLVLHATHHSFLDDDILQEFTMTTARHLIQEPDVFNRFEGKTFRDAMREGRQRGLEVGRQEGLEVGRQEGRQEGAAFTYRRSIIRLAHGRGLTLTADSHERLAACTDAPQLEAWLLLVGTAEGPVVVLE